jgi:hypothetical protein
MACFAGSCLVMTKEETLQSRIPVQLNKQIQRLSEVFTFLRLSLGAASFSALANQRVPTDLQISKSNYCMCNGVGLKTSQDLKSSFPVGD